MYKYQILTDIYDKDYIKIIDTIENNKGNFNFENFNLFMFEERFNSIAIEGNSLTKNEVNLFLDKEIALENKSFSDQLQAKNYNEALMLMSFLKNKDFEVDEELIKWLHLVITNGELNIKESGQYRNEPEHISTTSYLPPIETEVPYLMAELVEMYKRPLEEQTQFERICELKNNFEKIHPFFDGNGRTGRLLMNVLLLKNGYTPITIYPFEREKYFEHLEQNTFNIFAANKEIEMINIFNKDLQK